MFPQCYLTIFEGDHACIGYEVLLDMLGVPNLIDVYGRNLALRSKEALFPVATNFAVSKFYVNLYRK